MYTSATATSEIDTYLAKTFGWEKCLGRAPCKRPLCEDWRYFSDVPHRPGQKPPAYSQSLDALFAPGGAIHRLERDDWFPVIQKMAHHMEYTATMRNMDGDWESGSGKTAAIALAEACARALGWFPGTH